jgi:hypothetical protein
MLVCGFQPGECLLQAREPAALLDHDDFGLNQSKIMNVIDSKNLERHGQISLRNLRKLDCVGKPVPTFPHPALGVAALFDGRRPIGLIF